MTDPFKIVAVVSPRQGGEWLVLNRKPKFRYVKFGARLIAKDGPFADVLEGPWGNNAFGGIEFDIPMTDGTVIRAKGNWWASNLPGYCSIGISTEDDLRNCYVFGSGLVNPEALADLRSAYTGIVYPYWDYEKVLCFDGLRQDLYRRIWKLERDKKHLVRNVKRIASEAQAEMTLTADEVLRVREALQRIVDGNPTCDSPEASISWMEAQACAALAIVDKVKP